MSIAPGHFFLPLPKLMPANLMSCPQLIDAARGAIYNRRVLPETRDITATPAPRDTPARRFAELVDYMAQGPPIVADNRLVHLVRELRNGFDQQVRYDLQFNTAELASWCAGEPRSRRDGLICDGLEAMRAAQAALCEHDQWSTSRVELLSWNAFHQFYHDALAVADRLHACSAGRTPRSRVPRRITFDGASAFGRPQATANLTELAIPGLLDLRPLRGLLPVLVYQGIRTALPWPYWRKRHYLAKSNSLLTAGTLSSYAGGHQPALRLDGLDRFLANDDLFEPETGHSRHNIVIALSHRHSFLDVPFMHNALHRLRYAAWSNIQYFPKSAATDPQIIVVHPGAGRRLDGTLKRTAEVAIDARMPVTSFVDGGTPYLLYGQQMRVKPGIRMLIEHLVDRSQGTGRRTYLVPISFDDTTALVRGIEPAVTIRVHQPIDAADIAPAPRRPDRSSLNRGDPLPTYLEALFLTQTAQCRHGWKTPRVCDTVRQVRSQPPAWGLRPWLRRHLAPRILDLARYSAIA